MSRAKGFTHTTRITLSKNEEYSEESLKLLTGHILGMSYLGQQETSA